MSIRRFAMTCGPLAGLALVLATPALANPAMPHHQLPAAPGMVMPGAPMLPGSPPLDGAPDMRPVWQGAAAPMVPDSRARDAWMDECHRRTARYYGGSRRSWRHHNDWRRDDRAYSYCEAYFDDYYRTYAQRSHGYAMPMYAAPMMMSHAPMAQPARENCVETVTTEYVPIRTRYIPRRPAPRRVVPDKRVRDKRMLMD